MNTTFLREYKDITINLANDTQNEFVMDLLSQVFINDFTYDYNGEKLNIIDLNNVGKNGIHIVLQGATKIKQHKSHIRKNNNRKHKGKTKMYNNLVITGAMPEKKRHQYNTNIDEKFDNVNQLAERTGVTENTARVWIRKGWLKVEGE